MARTITSAKLFLLICVALTYGIEHAMAWKVDAHVWVAAEVYKDAVDGRITVGAGDKKFTVDLPRRYTAAIRAHPRLYLLGSLGPDAFPDVLGGQIVIHPSFPGGWGTSDWLRRLLSKPNLTSEELAFSLGYLSHAAADTFAHTFVNRYAGDLFQAFEHPTAATRHIYIEGLVSKYLPPISVPRLGPPRDAASLLRGGRRIVFPEALIRDQILLNGEAAKQFERGGALHLSAAYGLYRDLGNLTEQDGPLDQLQSKIKDFVAELYLGIPIDDRITQQLNKLENEITDKLNDAAADLKPILDDLNTDLAEIEGMPDKLAEESLKVAVDVAVEFAKLQRELDRWRSRANQLQNQIDDLTARGLDTVEKKVCSEWGVVLFGPAACLATKNIRVASVEITEFRNRLSAAATMISKSLAEVEAKREDLKDAISSGMAVLRERHELNRLARGAVIAMATDRPFGDGIRNHFLRWRDSIPIALVEFTRANAATIVNTVDPAIVDSFDPERPGLMDPLRDWLVCYGPVFLSVPATIGKQVCGGIEGVGTLKDKISEFEKKVGEVLPPLGDALRLKKEILTEIEKIKAKVLDEAMLQSLKAFDNVANAKTASFYEALATDITPSKVNQAMSTDDSGQRLPIIPDAAQRIIEELALNPNGRIDPDNFPAIYNSIVLTKLALLDANGLQRLARLAGVPDSSIYRNGLYGDGSLQAQNVLFGFLRSIDGNHQWQELAPPHPRDTEKGFDNSDFEQRRDDPENFGYGYRDAGCTRERGMRFWVDRVAREVVFKRIFRGRITSGIDEPQALGSGFSTALRAGYPDLYDQADGWLRDAIDWNQVQASLNLQLTGTGPAGHKIEVLVPGQNRVPIEIDAAGHLNVVMTVPGYLLPARIELVEIGGRSSLHYAFDIGCDGTPVQMGGEFTPMVIVDRGDNLWRISQRIVGDGRRYPELVQANAGEIADSDLIYPGQVLQSPWSMPFAIMVEAVKESAAANSMPH
ncbi:zinc dependent phospholipase C family protein [Mesorhizobium sp.]|uniref:zinc dependent phospholipase C family protein n=1 Tax=Mesorhizobium sp. TaxID=1871066 RepID=UPI000FE7FCD8|nr:zinc dependent phospholipase C family protein [Mesorhizobium sp.]RWO88583.1 MAG: LysM peptidoglycan-binding domain-containing protein [Mesorhizobium sp.]